MPATGLRMTPPLAAVRGRIPAIDVRGRGSPASPGRVRPDPVRRRMGRRRAIAHGRRHPPRPPRPCRPRLSGTRRTRPGSTPRRHVVWALRRVRSGPEFHVRAGMTLSGNGHHPRRAPRLPRLPRPTGRPPGQLGADRMPAMGGPPRVRPVVRRDGRRCPDQPPRATTAAVTAAPAAAVGPDAPTRSGGDPATADRDRADPRRGPVRGLVPIRRGGPPVDRATVTGGDWCRSACWRS
jgi:hypothetical protein